MAPFPEKKVEAQTDELTYSELSQVCRTPESGFLLLGPAADLHDQKHGLWKLPFLLFFCP